VFEEESAKPVPTIRVGEELSNMSVEELEERILALEAEIARCEADKKIKAHSLSAAEAAFKI